MLHLLQYYQNDFTFSPSLYTVTLCDNIGLVLLILRLAMLFCHSSYCTMCIIHPDLVSFTFYTIPISPLCNLKNFSFTCIMKGTEVLTLGAGREVLPLNVAVTKPSSYTHAIHLYLRVHVYLPCAVLLIGGRAGPLYRFTELAESRSQGSYTTR